MSRIVRQARDQRTQMLDAGGILPLPDNGKAKPGDREDVLLTRTYQHPAMDGRTVVRLVPTALGDAEDLTMEFLGFDRPVAAAAAAAAAPHGDAIGLVLRRSLGFPAWALVHDPANGHHALALVKDIERLARQAKTKPGGARDGFYALGKRLEASVPHFLPSYYEQAGRAFIAVENKQYAAGMFGKAREAERAHGLPVDEDLQAEVFLEFALSGALTAKAMTEYAKAIAARATPELAYQHFRRLVVERTAAGLPPYSALAADMKRLAQAAGLDVAAEEISMLRDLLESPSPARASKAFWTGYSSSLITLARAEPAVRGKLLALNPALPGMGNHAGDTFWLELLDKSGALESLTAPEESVPAEARSADGAMGWLNRFVKNRSRSWGWYGGPTRIPQLLDLVTRMAPRLLADDVPLNATATRLLDADLIDLCLALGIAVLAPENQHASFSVDGWLDEAAGNPGQRDLAAFAADAVFCRVLDRSVDDFARKTQTQGRKSVSPVVTRFAELDAVPGLRTGLSRWLAARGAEIVGGGGLPLLKHSLEALRHAASPKVFAVNPAAVQAVADFDVAPLLAESLRAGILDEFSWPALDEACARLTGRHLNDLGKGSIGVTEQWPYLVLDKKAHVVVVGPEGTALDHLSSMPTNPSPWSHTFRYADGQLLVQWYGYGNQGAYWSGEPLRQFEWKHSGYMDSFSSMELPGGGRSCGGRPLRGGDQTFVETGAVVSDGRTYWTLSAERDAQWQEFDPATGALGRHSLPSFFEDGLGAGDELVRGACRVRPVVPGTENSPLGTAGGLLGWRVRRHAGGTLTGEGIDGRSIVREADDKTARVEVPDALVWFPGAESPTSLWPVSSYGASTEYVLGGTRELGRFAVGEHGSKYARGTWCVPPPWYWNFFVARDERGSRFLRTLDAERARALMEAARGLSAPQAAKAIAALLPEVTNRNLILGIGGYVDAALAREAGVAKIRTVLAAATSRTEPNPNGTSGRAGKPTEPRHDPRLDRPAWNEALSYAVGGLAPIGHSYRNSPVPVGAHFAWLAATLDGQDVKADFADDAHAVQTLGLLAGLRGIVYRAASPRIPQEQRRILIDLVAAASASGVFRSGRSIRCLQAVSPEGKAPKLGTAVKTAHGVAVVLNQWTSREDGVRIALWNAVQVTEVETFDDLPGWTLRTETPVPNWPDGSLDRLVALLESGPAAEDPSAVERFSAGTGLTRCEAILLLAGLPWVGISSYGTQIDNEERKALGLTPMQAKLAVSRFDNVPVQQRPLLLGALCGSDPAQLWERGPDVEAAAEFWNDAYGKRAAVSEELLTAAYAGLAQAHHSRSVTVVDIVQGIAGLESWTPLQKPAEIGESFEATAGSITRVLIWLAYRLAAGDPLRAKLPEAAALLRARMCDPDVRVSLTYVEDIAKYEAALGVTRVVSGDVTAIGPLRFQQRTSWYAATLVPSELSGPDDPAYDAAATINPTNVTLVRTVLDGSLDVLTASEHGAVYGEGEAPGAESGAEQYAAQDATRSVPHLVEEAAARLGLSQDAAALYLMLLALPDPTDKNTADWTGWKPARMKAARAELAATPLVVSGARPRAGRSMFLPGGWHAFKERALPVEMWKSQWLGIQEDGTIELGLTEPRLPVRALFAAAWQRVVDGDEPRLTELKTGRNRTGSGR